jgi:isopentenyl-diphosphate delta-isomerase
MKKENIQKRKMEHLNIFRNEDVHYRKSAGFEKFHLLHNSLPEQNLDDIDISVDFLGYKLDFPFLINAMTGGGEAGGELNLRLAEIAETHRVAFALGSLRPCFKNKKSLKDYTHLKEISPNVPLIGNLGGQQLLEYDIQQIEDILFQINADALAIHLNPLQEALQPEGDTDFIGITEKIKYFAQNLSKPLIIKEVGFGLPLKNITELAAFGVKWFDLSGAGGTSWAKIEKQRNHSSVAIAVAEEFAEFGLPTAELLEKAVKITGVNIIASGGLNCGLDFVKALALGAKIGGSAGKVLQAWNKAGETGVAELLKIYQETLKIAVFITGCQNLNSFQSRKYIERCEKK